jgi:AraC-like DNA-binding protein
MRFDDNTREWRELMSVPYHLNNMILHDDILFAASEYGYWEYNPVSGEKIHHEVLQLTNGRKLATDVNTIAFDRQGGMWLGTEKRGILYSRPFRSAFVNYNWSQPEALAYEALLTRTLTDLPSLPRHVNCQYRDSRGWLWTGLYTGLQLERPDRKDIRIYTDEDGLRNEMIHSVIEDDNHDIWVGTSFGISHLMIADGEVVNIDTYTQSDNVPNESFVNARAMKQPDGTIIMQSLDHIVVFNPKNINRDSLVNMTLAPKLVRLMVNGQHMEPGMKLGDKVILDRAISRIWEVSVDYNQNTLSMIFSGLNFARPIQTYYRVRVQGLYDDWHIYSYMNAKDKVDEKGLLHLHLPALKPGKYVVEIQVSSSPDRFELRPYTWAIYVNEPWWRSSGIYLLLGLIVCLLAIANVIFYNYNTRLDMMRNNKEGDIMRRIRNYVTRCDELHNELLLPGIATTEEESADDPQQNNILFINTMLTIVPFIHSHANEKITMAMLSEQTGMEVTKLFELLSSNFYLSPRQMVGRLRLQEASELLMTTDKSVEEIANELMFVTPNYFISSFYHHFRQTPKDYRKSKAL